MKRCGTVYLRSKKLKPKQIRELTDLDPRTIRSHIRMYEKEGVEALKHRDPYRPKGELEEYKQSIEQAVKPMRPQRPPASIMEAGVRIFQLTGIRRSDTSVEVSVKRLRMTFRRQVATFFVFFNKDRNKLKILYWGNDDFTIWYKRLEKGSFRLTLPHFGEKSITLTRARLAMLLEGI